MGFYRIVTMVFIGACFGYLLAAITDYSVSQFRIQWRRMHGIIDISDQHPNAPLLDENFGMTVLIFLVAIRAVFGLFTTLIGCRFPMPRILYAMSIEGLLFSFLTTINEKNKTPFIAAIICGVCTGLLILYGFYRQLHNIEARRHTRRDN